jgi:hypothetical protein
MRHTALPAELEPELRAGHRDVPASERREPERAVVPAYSSLPTRISVFSSSQTTVASTFSRDRVGAEMSFSTRWRMRGSTSLKLDQPAELRVVANRRDTAVDSGTACVRVHRVP